MVRGQEAKTWVRAGCLRPSLALADDNDDDDNELTVYSPASPSSSSLPQRVPSPSGTLHGGTQHLYRVVVTPLLARTSSITTRRFRNIRRRHGRVKIAGMVDIETAWKASLAALAKGGTPTATAQAWTIARAALDAPTMLDKPALFQRTPEIDAALKTLGAAGLQDNVFREYLASVRDGFGVIQAHVLRYLDAYDMARGTHPDQAPMVIRRLLHHIGIWCATWQRVIEAYWATGTQHITTYRNTFFTSLYAILPPRFSAAFTVYLRHILYDPQPTDTAYPLAMPTLISLLDRYDPLLFGLVYEEIEKKVERDCKGEFAEPRLARLLEWLNDDVLEWVGGFYATSLAGGQEEAKKMLKPTFSRFDYHVNKTLGALRTTELFDIIIDYPDSKPAMEDLKTCLVKTDQRKLLVNRLTSSMQRRLLHPGAETKDIITQYIATIRSLRIVDPQGVLLSRIADPIRQYLRSREDTIRCIVSSLIEEGNELVAELVATDAKPLQDARDEAENFNDPKWTPDPIDAPVDYRKTKGSDIIQLLVSIYDTKDVFVKELQVLLAQRLLLIKDYALEREIKNVEILKIRFGEASLQGCEVMIKDLQDSRRTDLHVHEQAPNTPIHATIVSRLFWPTFQTAPLKLPGQLGVAQSEYTKAYSALKPDKKLRWLPQLGSVNLTIELKDRSITVDAPPLQASIIELFTRQDTWTEDDLATELELVDSSTVRNALYFWNNAGVVKNVSEDVWKLLEVKDEGAEAAVFQIVEDEKEAVQSVDSQLVEQMRVFWKFLQGMLTNLGPQPVTRMHTTLNTLVETYKGHTVEELTSLLEVMQVEGLVEKSGNNWKIVK